MSKNKNKVIPCPFCKLPKRGDVYNKHLEKCRIKYQPHNIVAATMKLSPKEESKGPGSPNKRNQKFLDKKPQYIGGDMTIFDTLQDIYNAYQLELKVNKRLEAESLDQAKAICYLKAEYRNLRNMKEAIKETMDFGHHVNQQMISLDMREVYLMSKLELEYGYTGVKMVGKGSYGTVFLCNNGDQQLAIKVPHTNHSKMKTEIQFLQKASKNS